MSDISRPMTQNELVQEITRLRTKLKAQAKELAREKKRAGRLGRLVQKAQGKARLRKDERIAVEVERDREKKRADEAEKQRDMACDECITDLLNRVNITEAASKQKDIDLARKDVALLYWKDFKGVLSMERHLIQEGIKRSIAALSDPPAKDPRDEEIANLKAQLHRVRLSHCDEQKRADTIQGKHWNCDDKIAALNAVLSEAKIRLSCPLGGTHRERVTIAAIMDTLDILSRTKSPEKVLAEVRAKAKEEAYREFSHTFVTRHYEDDGCARCGHDIRHPVHPAICESGKPKVDGGCQCGGTIKGETEFHSKNECRGGE